MLRSHFNELQDAIDVVRISDDYPLLGRHCDVGNSKYLIEERQPVNLGGNSKKVETLTSHEPIRGRTFETRIRIREDLSTLSVRFLVCD
jgi:hypothetical protein